MTAPEISRTDASEHPTTAQVLRQRKQKYHSQKGWARLATSLVLVAFTVWMLFGVVFGVTVVHGDSMTPAVKSGDMAFLYRLGSYRRGDIVTCSPEGDSCIKRIVGIPTDTVDIAEESHRVLINGLPLDEPYVFTLTGKPPNVHYPFTLDDNEYFVLGDCREDSRDSRYFGAIPRNEITGKVIAIARTGHLSE